jgi:hypothetical protein
LSVAVEPISVVRSKAMKACVGTSALTHCQECESTLRLHQPDPELPDRLLGTCDDCKSWFLIDLAEEIVIPLFGKRTEDHE